jgi:Fe-Mn family superoxide dismutase
MYETSTTAPATGTFTLPPLPFAPDAIEPAISRRTIELHHGKHHRAYVEKLNELVAGTELATLSLDEVVKRTAGDKQRAEIANNAGQAWNHHFYWRSLAPHAGPPPERMRSRLDRDLGGYAGFVEAFTAAATARFGSGWAWLVADRGTLEIVTTANAGTPLARELTPLLTLDVWEHAYYLDYQNRREEYVRAVVERHLNWEFASQNLERD